jgi:hypothetical protein
MLSLGLPAFSTVFFSRNFSVQELTKEKVYNTPSIELARGKFKYKNTWFNRIKKLIDSD